MEVESEGVWRVEVVERVWRVKVVEGVWIVKVGVEGVCSESG
jgi:hypothetical protein